MPGIPGYQQVTARGKPLSECVHLELEYMRRQSLIFDLYILLKTIVVVLRGDGVS